MNHRINRILFVSAILAALGTTAYCLADDPQTSSPGMSLDQQLIYKLHQSNQDEIAAGKLAEQQGSSSQVKAFGKKLVQDHEKADRKVMAFAKKNGIDLSQTPPMSEQDQKDVKDMQEQMADLKATQGADFDRKFKEDMISDHQKDVAELKDALPKIQNSQEKKLVSQMIPVIEKHETIARNLPVSSAPSSTATG